MRRTLVGMLSGGDPPVHAALETLLCKARTMVILHPGAGPGRSVDQFGSLGAWHLGGVRFSGDGALTFLHLAPGGRLGRHPAPVMQLYCVVGGVGWVAGDDRVRVPVTARDAALWTAGEEHESGTDTGMTVAVLEVTLVHVT